ncbi:MAG: hypothetical protein RL017_488 [Pseudomonadota bacterium]|jgi:hypothetical protein
MLRKDLNSASLVELLGVEFDKIKDELKIVNLVLVIV